MSERQKIVNDFSIKIGTANGSGSQTANSIILRSLFKMGIPVSGKNLFPSNIQGLPTWYIIRANKDGFIAYKDESEIVVCINPASFLEDVLSVVPGGAFFYADDIKIPIQRTDIALYPMPVKELARTADVTPNLRDYVANMVYVGVLARMLGIDLDTIRQALYVNFKGKEKAVQSNFDLVMAASDWAAVNLTKNDPYQVEPMDRTSGLIMTDGNTAGALGAIYGGVQFAAWYPITPATSLAESLNEYLPQLRKRPDGKHTYVVLQAEDELAAIGMAIGAGWAGLRAMTSTSGPGFSLMTEYSGLAYFAEIPVVIWDVQRIGPSTGLPTRTAQGDLTFTYFMGHGDSQHVILLPGSVEECFEFGWRALDLAERLQTPVFVLSDLDLGMNHWMAKPFTYPDQPLDRGKVLREQDLERMNGAWSRYRDLDGDGIAWRTLPGNHHPAGAYFARGTGHDENALYSEDPGIWEANMERLLRKYETARTLVPRPEVEASGRDVGIIYFGSNQPVVQETRYLLAQAGIQTDALRLRALPCTQELRSFVESHARVYVVENNRDGQLRQILSMALQDSCGKFISLNRSNGLPLTARWLKEAFLGKEIRQ